MLTGNLAITLIAGIEGIICGASGVYIGLAEVLNDLYDRKMLPSVDSIKEINFFLFFYFPWDDLKD